MQLSWVRLVAATSLAISVCSFGLQTDVLAAADTLTGGEQKTKGGDNQKQGQSDYRGNGHDQKKHKTPEELMQARFPQPTMAGHLLDLPLLDYNDSTIGYVRQVVRTSDGKIQLIVPYGKRFGWARDWWPFNIGRHLVAVPIETVAILALQINALDMTRDDFDKAERWISEHDQVLPPQEVIKIALGRR